MPVSSHDQLLAEWFDWMDKQVKSGQMSAETSRSYRLAVKRFSEYVQRSGLPMVNRRLVEQFKDDSLLTHSDATVRLWLAGVKSFYGWAVNNERMQVNPAVGVKAGKRRGANAAHVREPITDDEARALLAADLHPRDAAIVALMLYCAMRGVAIRRANYQDLATKGGKRILFVQEKGKTDKQEYKVIPRPALLKLNAWLKVRGSHKGPLFESMSKRSKGKRLAASSLRTIVGDAFRKAQIMAREGTAAGKSHRLRHTAITTLLKSGGSLRHAQTLAGHADPKTTMIYAHEIDRTQNAPEDLIDYGES